MALELISTQKSVITLSKKSNITLKIRKGNPNGCKVTLRKEKMYNFFFRLISEIIPQFKTFNNFLIKTAFYHHKKRSVDFYQSIVIIFTAIGDQRVLG